MGTDETNPPAPVADDSRPRRAARVLFAVALLALAGGASAGAAWWLRSLREDRAGADPAAANADLVKRGRVVYGVYCAACHGTDGHGDGPSAAQLKPPPRDFAVAQWKHGSDRATVRRVIAEGIRGMAMPASRDTLSAGDLDAVVPYVLTMVPRQHEGAPPPAMRALLRQVGLAPIEPVRAAPPLELCGADGQRLALADLRGQVVLVQFWETMCVPCLHWLPHLEHLANEYRGRGLFVPAVCLDEEDAQRLRTVSAKYVKSLPVYADARGTARASLDVSALPAACLIDRDGQLVGTGSGPEDWDASEVRALLNAWVSPDPAGGK
jgi:mono/diheme cytochrome c family protein/peroxiredoxin